MPSAPILLWLRQDLRLDDHPALSAAAAAGPVVPVYVLDDSPQSWGPGGASRWWLHHSLAALGRDLAERGAPLILRRGDPAEIIPRLVAETGARALYVSRLYDGHNRAIGERIRAALPDTEIKSFNSALLFEPWSIRNKAGQPYRVFTPFWRCCLEQGPPPPPQPAPERLSAPAALPASLSLDDLALLPVKPDWAGGLRQSWTPGEAAARECLGDFVEDHLANYHLMRDRPDQPGTSRLSPYLHFGEISPRRIWHEVAARNAPGGDSFLRELGWREFCHNLLHLHPDLPERSLKAEFVNFPWAAEDGHFDAWTRGRTGYPIVDAGMRAMWHSGWMHNRVRMIVGSFLVKDLLLPWQKGEAWFWDVLVDADLASNAAGWQWISGSGADAAPYFRVFNPVLQGEKFDPRGRYVRQWVPELARMPDMYIHRPWEAPPHVLREAGVELGVTYPRPIVDHGAARRRALAAYEQTRAQEQTEQRLL